MGLFGSDKKKVSKQEFKQVRSNLNSKGLSTHEINEVEKLFRGDLNESMSTQSGIDSKEIDRGIKWLRENKSKHNFSNERISTIEESLKKKL